MDADFYLLPALKAELKVQLAESTTGKVAYCRLVGVGIESNYWQWRMTETNTLSPPRFELKGGNNHGIVVKKVPHQ